MSKTNPTYKTSSSQLLKQWRWQNLALAVFKHGDGTVTFTFKASYYDKRNKCWVERKTIWPQEVPVMATMWASAQAWLEQNPPVKKVDRLPLNTHTVGDVAEAVLSSVKQWSKR
jgi:hypothetical protein